MSYYANIKKMYVQISGLYSFSLRCAKDGDVTHVFCSNVDADIDMNALTSNNYYYESTADATFGPPSDIGYYYSIDQIDSFDEVTYSLDGGNHSICIARAHSEPELESEKTGQGFVIIPKDQTSRTVFDYGGNDVSAIDLLTDTASEEAFYDAGLMKMEGPVELMWPDDHAPQKIVFGTALTAIGSTCIHSGMNSAGSNIKDIVIPTSITNIDLYAFIGSSVSSVTFIGRTTSEIQALDTNGNLFSLPFGCALHGTNGTLVVNSGSVN